MERLTALRSDTEQLSKTMATNEDELSVAKDKLAKLDMLIRNYLITYTI